MISVQQLRYRSIRFVIHHQHFFLSAGIILGLMGSAMAIGWLSKRGISFLSLILAGTFLALGLLIGYRLGRFEYGILAVPITAGLVNFYTLPTGTESRIVFSLLISLGMVGVWILQLFLSKDRVFLKPSSLNRPVKLFVVVSFISYFWSILLRDPQVFVWNSFPYVQLAALAVNVTLPLFALFVANKIEDMRWLKYIAWIVVGLGAFIIFSIVTKDGLNRLFFNGSRGLFATWACAICYALALFDKNLSRWVRLALLGVVLAWLYYYYVLNVVWLSGWIPIVIACAVITFFRSRRLFVIGVIIGTLYLALDYNKLYQQIVVSNINEGSAGRIILWEINIDLVMKHPLFGVGPAGYAVYYMTYNPTDARSTHNNYFDVLAQTGIVGFVIFIWMMITFLKLANRARLIVKNRETFSEAFAAAVIGGGVASMVAMMLGDWVLPFAYNQTITGFDNASFTWLFLGGGVALYQILKAKGTLRPDDITSVETI